MTAQIAWEIKRNADDEDVGVVIECRHPGTMMLGVQEQNIVTVTSSVLGSLHKHAATRAEFLTLIERNAGQRAPRR